MAAAFAKVDDNFCIEGRAGGVAGRLQFATPLYMVAGLSVADDENRSVSLAIRWSPVARPMTDGRRTPRPIPGAAF